VTMSDKADRVEQIRVLSFGISGSKFSFNRVGSKAARVERTYLQYDRLAPSQAWRAVSPIRLRISYPDPAPSRHASKSPESDAVGCVKPSICSKFRAILYLLLIYGQSPSGAPTFD